MTQAIEWLAEVVNTKQQQRIRRNGLDQHDHAMFNRALNRYRETEKAIAAFRARQPVGTSDVRASEDWKPTTHYVAPKVEKKVDNRPRNAVQSVAINSLFRSLKNS